MTTDTVLDRFKDCNTEIEGVVRVDRLLPTKPILAADLPAMYTEPLNMVSPAPGSPSAARRSRSQAMASA